ncbi:GntR family transcriptional regulator (plasmid) [Diaphorobacter sp. HDW4A]|uniref:GntR family transcriptional regulator n=1 Tax=Diaphorobacter sp. HDW4A TaxID=2714924 RepID=UPI00140E1F3D|nr:GntR family transcriptional regulator [Diaphorobacter sp. HDW4A]QIL84210.1 GntR family transcriptional regulator [Diaphorobacter sp. HDW4A]
MRRTQNLVALSSVASEESGHSQTVKAVIGLRGMILEGALKAGERVLEQMVVDKINVSRTPARAAILRLCEEGMIDALPGGGYAVASFSEADVFDSIAIRGELEGMAARLAAERGAPLSTLQKLDRCVAALDVVLQSMKETRHVTQYVELNDEFHALLIEAAQSPMLKKSIQRIVTLPFAAPNCFISTSHDTPAFNHQIMLFAQEQHRSLVEAIRAREGARAEAIAREHSRSAWKYIKALLELEDYQSKLPAVTRLSPALLGIKVPT